MNVKLSRRLCALRDDIPLNAIGSIKQNGYEHFHWIGHDRTGPFTWASKGKPSKAILVAFPQGERWCWPNELSALK